jgi:hypothetical protein
MDDDEDDWRLAEGGPYRMTITETQPQSLCFLCCLLFNPLCSFCRVKLERFERRSKIDADTPIRNAAFGLNA